MNANQIFLIDADTIESIKKLSVLIEDVCQIKKMLTSKMEDNAPLGDWITEINAIRLLGKKKTSLYKLRKAGELIFSETRPVFYSLTSIKNYLEKNKK